MRVLVYSHRIDRERAFRKVDALRADGYTASWRDAKEYRGEVERCDLVVTDLSAVTEAYRAAGVPVERLIVLPEAPADVPAPMQAHAAGGGDPVSEGQDEKPKRRPRRPRRPKA